MNVCEVLEQLPSIDDMLEMAYQYGNSATASCLSKFPHINKYGILILVKCLNDRELMKKYIDDIDPASISIRYAIDTNNYQLIDSLLKIGAMLTVDDVIYSFNKSFDIGKVYQVHDVFLRICMTSNVKAIEAFISHGIVPQDNVLVQAINNGNSTVIKLLKPYFNSNMTIMNYAINYEGNENHEHILSLFKMDESYSFMYKLCGNRIDLYTLCIACCSKYISYCKYVLYSNGLKIKPNNYTLNNLLISGYGTYLSQAISDGAVPIEDTLTIACYTDCVDDVRRLIDIGAKPDQYTLTVACAVGNYFIVKMLITIGALPNEDTLIWAKYSNNSTIVKLVEGF